MQEEFLYLLDQVQLVVYLDNNRCSHQSWSHIPIHIEYVTISTLGDAIDFGDLLTGKSNWFIWVMHEILQQEWFGGG